MDIGLNSSGGSRAIELTKDVEAGDEADEAEAHDEDNGGRNLQAWSIVSVESEHVSAAAWSAAYESSRGSGRSGADTAAAEASSRRRGAARSDDARSGSRGGCGLGLRSASGHRFENRRRRSEICEFEREIRAVENKKDKWRRTRSFKDYWTVNNCEYETVNWR